MPSRMSTLGRGYGAIYSMGLFGKSSPKPDQEREMSPGLTPSRSILRSDNRGETLQATSAEYDVGVASDCNQRYRKTMEDSHVVITDFMDVPGCAYFAVFDGHAGAQCAKAVSEHLHLLLADVLHEQPKQKDVALALSSAFQLMDEKLPSMDIRHAGCTAAVAVACYMNEQSEFVSPKDKQAQRKLFVANAGDSRAVLGVPHVETHHTAHSATLVPSRSAKSTGSAKSASSATANANEPKSESENTSASADGTATATTTEDKSESATSEDATTTADDGQGEDESEGAGAREASTSASASGATMDSASDATVPDSYQHPSLEARRLTYDHRCSDPNEQRRIANKGGLMINNRVNGMLAVTRSLGDLLMKDFVVGTPYTTESTLPHHSGHEVLVLACDGLWDVCSDEKAVQIAHQVLSEGGSPLSASEKLVAHALEEFSVDNLTVLVATWN